MSFGDIGRGIWRTGFEGSPVILTRGIAAQWTYTGGMIPIVLITEAANLLGDLINLTLPTVDQMFAHWQVLPGTQLMRNDIGSYPFASQSVAANAIVKNPLTISMVMHCPVQNPGGFLVKLATIAALKMTLDYHNQNGGTYTVATPSYIYTDCVLVGITDVSGGESEQVQTSWQFDFVQPLIVAPSDRVMSKLMNKLSNGTEITGDPSWSGFLESNSSLSSFSGFVANIPTAVSNLF